MKSRKRRSFLGKGHAEQIAKSNGAGSVERVIGCLIVHGYTGGPYEVEPLERYLVAETNWEISVPTLQGHGEQLNFTDVRYTDWIGETERALMKLHQSCDRIFVIGFSMGGMIAAYLAATSSVDKLVLLAPARKILSFKYLGMDLVEMIGDGLKGKLTENDRFVQVKGKLADVSFAANMEFMKLVQYTKAYIPHVKVPVFIAQGKKDELVPYQTIYTIEEEIGSTEKEIVFFGESDHFICLSDDGSVLNQLVHRFLCRDDHACQLKEESLFS